MGNKKFNEKAWQAAMDGPGINQKDDIYNSPRWLPYDDFKNNTPKQKWETVSGQLTNMDKWPPAIDPKQSCAEKKLSFNSVPHSLLPIAERACRVGANKYGLHNWLSLPDESMSVMTYLNAVQRHLTLYKAGQNNSSDCGVCHLDAIIAGLCIIRDAQLHNKVKDDRQFLNEEQLKTLEELINNV